MFARLFLALISTECQPLVTNDSQESEKNENEL
jgi:hypothetical protein